MARLWWSITGGDEQGAACWCRQQAGGQLVQDVREFGALRVGVALTKVAEGGESLPGLVVFRYDAELFYATTRTAPRGHFSAPARRGRISPPSGATIYPLRRDRLGGLVHEYVQVA